MNHTLTPIILYEDDSVIIINKPAGLIVHSDGRTAEPSVAEWILGAYPSLAEVGEPWVSPQGETILRPGIVHRLDRQTSGALAIAKTVEAHAFLKQEFQERKVGKTYRAFVYGHPRYDRGTIEMEILRVRSDPPRWGVKRLTVLGGEQPSPIKKHRAAITDWKLLRAGYDASTREKAASLEVRPKTGRTHQIRVHLSARHHPVIADTMYAPGRPPLLGFTRTALHALSLEMTLPSGEKKHFEAPFPDDFLTAEKLLLGDESLESRE